MSDEQKSKINEQRYLQFGLGSESYAIPLLRVREVVGVPETTPIPYTPNYFVGMMNLRGQVISVLDLRKKMGITSASKGSEQAVIILDLDPVYVGVLVDSVSRVISMGVNEIGEAPVLEGGKRVDHMIGVYRENHQLTTLLDLGKLLNMQDIKAINSNAKAA